MTYAAGRGSLILNGIWIGKVGRYYEDLKPLNDFDFDILRIGMPRLIVWDYDGLFPVNLQRDDVDLERFELKGEIVDACVTEFLALLLVCREWLYKHLFLRNWDSLHKLFGKKPVALPFAMLDYASGRTDWHTLPSGYIGIGKGRLLFAEANSLSRSGIDRAIVLASSRLENATPIVAELGDGIVLLHLNVSTLGVDTANKYTEVVNLGRFATDCIEGRVCGFVMASQIVNKFRNFKRETKGLRTNIVENVPFRDFFGSRSMSQDLVKVAKKLIEVQAEFSAVFELTGLIKPRSKISQSRFPVLEMQLVEALGTSYIPVDGSLILKSSCKEKLRRRVEVYEGILAGAVNPRT
jgi:hypothetical protein